jgi:hypothetical protein
MDNLAVVEIDAIQHIHEAGGGAQPMGHLKDVQPQRLPQARYSKG